MKSLKRILLVSLIVAIFAISSSIVLATEFEDDFEFIPDDNSNNIDINNLLGNNTINDTLNDINTNNTINDTTTNLVNNEINNTNTGNNTNDTNTLNANNNTNTANNANSSTYNNSSNNSNLPKAGSNDGFVLTTIMIVFGAMALYAYKKVRDYNLK